MSEREKYIIVIDGQLIEVAQEVYEVYYKGKRKEKYFMQDLKVGRCTIDRETGEKIYLPSREDSFERLAEVTKQFEDDVTDVEKEVLDKIMVEDLHKALEMLKPEEKELIWKLYFEEISEVELSKRTGISRTTLQYRKYQILKKLKQILECRGYKGQLKK